MECRGYGRRAVQAVSDSKGEIGDICDPSSRERSAVVLDSANDRGRVIHDNAGNSLTTAIGLIVRSIDDQAAAELLAVKTGRTGDCVSCSGFA